jgi:RNA polymerase sigma factor (sigma-70 family)
MATPGSHPDEIETFETWFGHAYKQVVGAMVLSFAERDVAEEAAQEAFARAYERWDRVSRMERPTAWVFVVATNCARRRIRRRTAEALMFSKSRSPASVPEETGMELWDLVRTLPERERTAIVLRYVGDLSEREVAQAMGITPGGVAKTLNRARGRMAKSLAPGREIGDLR